MKSSYILLMSLVIGTLTFDAQAISISLGANIARHELLSFTDKDLSSKAAHFSSDFYVSPSLHIDSSPWYFSSSSRFGWLIEFNFGVLEIPQEQTTVNGQSYEGLVTGAFGHFNPVLFYRLGDKYRKGPRHWSLTAGVGYGLSYLMLDGSYVTTNLAPEDREIVTINNAEGYFLLPAVLLDYNYKNWYAKISACFGGDGFHAGDYVYGLLFRSVGVGRSFEF